MLLRWYSHQTTHNASKKTDMPPLPGSCGHLVPVLFLLLSVTVAVVAVPARTRPLQPPPPPTNTPTAANPTTMYDENIAKTLADYCAAAYSCGSFQGCGNWSCKSCQARRWKGREGGKKGKGGQIVQKEWVFKRVRRKRGERNDD